MNKPRPARRLSSLLLALALAACGGVAEAAIVCVGLDGHAAIEPIADGCCSVAPASLAVQVLSRMGAGDDSCFGCVDFGLELDALSAAKKTMVGQQTALLKLAGVENRSIAVRASSFPERSNHDWLSDVVSSVVILT